MVLYLFHSSSPVHSCSSPRNRPNGCRIRSWRLTRREVNNCVAYSLRKRRTDQRLFPGYRSAREQCMLQCVSCPRTHEVQVCKIMACWRHKKTGMCVYVEASSYMSCSIVLSVSVVVLFAFYLFVCFLRPLIEPGGSFAWEAPRSLLSPPSQYKGCRYVPLYLAF